MQFWGRLLGTLFGFMFARIPGAILGFVVGYFFDRGYSQNFDQMGGFGRFFTDKDSFKSQAIFFHSLFSVMGHIAKADGQVTKAEINIASDLMQQMGLQGDVLKEAQQAFREGKAADFPLKETLKEFKQSCHGRRDIMQVYLEILIQAAYVDGRLDNAEQAVLEKVARQLGFRQNELLYLMSAYEAELRFRQGSRRHHQRQSSHSGQGRQRSQQQGPAYSEKQSLSDAYRILGCSEQQDEKSIKKAYRRLMSEHHPDKLVSKGLPKEAMEIAKNKAQDIQAAYEMVKKHRKFR